MQESDAPHQRYEYGGDDGFGQPVARGLDTMAAITPSNSTRPACLPAPDTIAYHYWLPDSAPTAMTLALALALALSLTLALS